MAAPTPTRRPPPPNAAPPTAAGSLFQALTRPRVVALIGGALFVVGVVGLGDGLRYEVFGRPAIGRAVNVHAAQARSASVIASVEVDMPPDPPFVAQIDDWAGLANWQDGAPVLLRCAAIRSDHVSCLYDSALEIFLQPAIFAVLGLVGIAYGATRR